LPVFYYFLLKLATGKIQSARLLTLCLVIVPLLLSLSFGVLGATLITAVILVLTHLRHFRNKRLIAFAASMVLLMAATIFTLWVIHPENALFVRLENIFSGDDTSARGRTTESFGIAWRIASLRSIWFGIGLGQVKHVMVDLVRLYYNYWGSLPRYDIPNAMAETLAIFGLSGVALRLCLEWWLFFRTRVYANYYRLALFIFIFIYQFTGSFITNVAEYVVWLLAFSSAFTVFDKRTRQKPEGN
jgi:hypothetical protein